MKEKVSKCHIMVTWIRDLEVAFLFANIDHENISTTSWIEQMTTPAMASPATKEHLKQSVNDGESDYGSDFSPEEAEIVGNLLSWKPIEDVEDNPIVNEIEHHDPQRSLRLPRKLGREQMSPLFQAARAAEEVAEQISKSIKTGEQYPDCKSPSRPGMLDKSD
jgi:hypothetical protein